jgi:hypothetical protein
MFETFVIQRRIQRDIIINIHKPSCTYQPFLSDLNETPKFLVGFSKNTQISNSMKLLSVGTEFFHADGQTDTHDKANSHVSQFCGSA